ncbi:hypothetical protein DV736_g4360, partial [Chaetothyriales sp. CBS 134916]
MTNCSPLSTAITSPSQLATLTAHYPAIATAHYKSRLKDPVKASTAIQRDYWRYDQLPAELLQSQKPDADTDTSISLDLPDLEKLVQWKITHGHFRPFLPAMIRKNDSDTVKKATAEGARKLFEALQLFDNAVKLEKEGSLNATITTITTAAAPNLYKAIESFCQLTGVGPATGSLIGSVYSPEQVPFFADETYAWLVDGGQSKLKYDKKEYLALLKAMAELRDRLSGVGLRCVDIEKAAFVVMHLDLLGDEKERAEIELLFKRPGLDKVDKKVTEQDTPEAGVIKQAGKRRVKSLPKPVAAKETRHSKRAKR